MKALIVVDMQKDFIDGVLGTKEAVAIVSGVAEKIKAYRRNGDTVIFTRDTHTENYLETQEGRKLPVAHCIKDTPGWQISDALDVGNSKVIDKPTFGSLALVETLKKLNEKTPFASIELVGLCTDICVISNAMLAKAAFWEIPVRVDASCCAGVSPATHENALTAMDLCQIEITGRQENVSSR